MKIWNKNKQENVRFSDIVSDIRYEAYSSKYVFMVRVMGELETVDVPVSELGDFIEALNRAKKIVVPRLLDQMDRQRGELSLLMASLREDMDED